MRRFALRPVAVLLLVGSVAVMFFYIAASEAARLESNRSGLPPAARNGIKHAYAAAETFAWLRSIGVGPDTATEWIVHLALINEWVEAWFKWPRDTTAEVYKDLRNGVLGIAALRANEKCAGLGSPDKRLRLIGKLASARTLLWSEADLRIPPMPVGHDVSAAIAMFKSDRAAIEHEALSTVRILAICAP
jgi:hypothetical protein